MNRCLLTIATAFLSLDACGSSLKQPHESEKAASPVSSEASPAVPAPGTGPDARTPLGAAKAAIGATSPEAAREVAQQVTSLIEQGRFSDAAGLWDNKDVGEETLWEMKRSFKYLSDMHFSLGVPEDEEGAAGSIYITVPAELSAKDRRTGSAVSGDWKIVLRRVNEVPGSSVEQRQWHIHEFSPPPVP